MSTDEQDPAVPDGIHDTADLARIWDALELLAGQVDGREADATHDGEEAPPTDP